MFDKVLSLILRETWAMDAGFVAAYQERALKFISGQTVDFSDITSDKELKILAVSASGMQEVEGFEQENGLQEETVAIFNIRGTMLKYGDMCTYGTEDIARSMQSAMNDDRVKAIIMTGHSPGGITCSVFPLKEVIHSRTKPVIGLVDNMSCSANYYPMSMCDKVFAIDEMAQVGSIGAMAMMVKKKEEEADYQVIEMYPKESSYKNLPQRQALEGNTAPYIEEYLKPWAINFQNHVKKYRGDKLKPDAKGAEGLLEGRVFYASDAVKYGLIDGIQSLDNTIQYAFDLAASKSILTSIK